MNKRTVIICAIIAAVSLPLFIFFTSRNARRQSGSELEDSQKAAEASASESESDEADSSESNGSDSRNSDFMLISEPSALRLESVPDGNEADPSSVTLRNGVFTITFDSKGACASSIILNEYKDQGSDLEMLYKDDPAKRAFVLYHGCDLANPLDDVFEIEQVTSDSVTFRRDYSLNGKPVTLRKAYELSGQYMIKLNVSLSGIDSSDIAAMGDCIYSVEFAPYLGPKPRAAARSRSASADARNYYIKKDKKRRGINFSGSSKNVFTYKEGFDWFEWTGKYFSFIAVPDPAKRGSFGVSVFKRAEYDNSVYVIRNKASDARQSGSVLSDDIYFYIGPQLKNELALFDYAQDNDFHLSGLSLSKAMEGGGALTWLQNILKYIMSLFYRLVPNWGVSILLLTLLIRILLYPLSARSAKSAAAMQKVAPRLEQIRKDFADDPQAQNQAIMALYKKNGINPLSSLLPMLIQLPILFAVYGLLNKHFELRGAMFIPGWIEDLSMPETVFEFPFNIPLLGNQLHLLPIIYGLSMVFSMMWTGRQNTAGQTKGLQAFMTYGLPVILFFSLYNVSSGLLVYWTVTNVFSILQQSYENRKLKRADAQAEGDKPAGKSGKAQGKALPPKAKKKKNRR